MVYAELKLELKVDWSTYSTTMQYPLYIGKTKKEVDMYTSESVATIGILGFLKKKPQGASGQGLSSKKEATLKAAQVHETSNPIPQKLEPMVQNPPLSVGDFRHSLRFYCHCRKAQVRGGHRILHRNGGCDY